MYLPLVQDLIQMIKKEGGDCYLHFCDVARAYWHLPLNPADWPHVCIKAGGRYYTDARLLLSLRWAVAYCHDVISLIVRDLVSKGLKILS